MTHSILPAANTKEDQLVCHLIAWALSDADSVALGAADAGMGQRLSGKWYARKWERGLGARLV